MKRENTMIHRELERTQDHNRKLLTELNNLSFSKNTQSPNPSLNNKFRDHKRSLHTSLNGRKTATSVYSTPLSTYDFPIKKQNKELSKKFLSFSKSTLNLSS